MPNPSNLIERLADQPLIRVAAYYLMLAALVLVLHRVDPNLRGLFEIGAAPEALDLVGGPERQSAGRAAFEAGVAMTAAFLLSLPVAWIYLLTRRMRGYQQSLIQTAVILPLVVAGVVILVKTSVALAFSLGGIVGAIAFRNRLDDTKDAVHVFVSIGVGLACGVQVLSVAAVLSVFYNVVQLLVWWADFGRVPAPLEGPPAQQRLQALKAVDDRRSEAFVSQVDTLLLKSMNPAQLESVLKRADKRRRRVAEEIDVPAAPLETGRRNGRLRLIAPTPVLEEARRKVEPILDEMAKRWSLEGAATEDGRTVASYEVRMKKKRPSADLVAAVQKAVGNEVETVELV
jgi:hypothetical protein